MKDIKRKYQRIFLLALTMIALGISFNTTLELGSIGTVFIAVGGLFFIIAMSLKKEEDSKNN